MISHDGVGVDLPAEAHCRLAQRALKRLRRTLPLEQVAPVVPAVDHVVTRPCKLDAQRSRHDRKESAALGY